MRCMAVNSILNNMVLKAIRRSPW
uniref:Uncharacterized protein n=1 Tax=Rhizophora mucronata TaxID=61149 RepID=A0A2P2NRI1_RHIMU